MSIFFREKNKEKTQDLFEKKGSYQQFSKSEYTSLVDFQFAEKALYGRVDRLYLPIVAKDYYLEFKSVPTDGSPLEKNVQALNFVVDNFLKVKNQFLKKMELNEISKSEKFLSKLQAYKGYESPHKLYNEHINIYISAFEELVKDQNIKFLNFDHFVEKLFPFLKKTMRLNPFTFPAFVKSSYCPINASGLVIEIANELDHANDVKKMQDFYNSPNWEFYLNVCANFGFMVDRNNPWRLVADIASSDMLEAAEVYGINSTDSVLNIAYKKAHKDYFDKFKIIMYNMYHKLKKKRFSSVVTLQSGGERIVTRKPIEYSYIQFIEDHDDAYFLNLYCKMRFIEEESHFSHSEQQRIISNTIELSNINLMTAIDSFEKILNKTFDYNGSLSYTTHRIRKARE